MNKVTGYRLQVTVIIATLFLLLPVASRLSPARAQTTACPGSGAARASGLVSTPNIIFGSKFNTSPGACIVDPKAAFTPFKIPSYADLKSLYYTQSKASKPAPITALPSTIADQTVYITPLNTDLTVSTNPTGGGTATIFVEGNLNITADYTYGSPTTGTVFVVSGNVNIDSSVTRVDAIIIAGGTICTAYDGTSCPSTNVTTSALTVNGSLISLNDANTIKFRRTLLDNSCPTCAAEKIINQPKYLVILRDLFSETLQRWQEISGSLPILPVPPAVTAPSGSP